MRATTLLALALTAGSVAPLSAQRLGRIVIDAPFPELNLPMLDGETRALADYRGRRVVLHVFASW